MVTTSLVNDESPVRISVGLIVSMDDVSSVVNSFAKYSVARYVEVDASIEKILSVGRSVETTSLVAGIYFVGAVVSVMRSSAVERLSSFRGSVVTTSLVGV